MAADIPVFIKLEEYDEVLSIAAVIRKKLEETKQTLSRIKQLKIEEDQEFLAWEDNIKSVHEKIDFVDELLKKPRF